MYVPPPVGTTENAMVSIRLPDGSVRQYEHPVTVAEVAASIGPGLAKAALGGKIDKSASIAQNPPPEMQIGRASPVGSGAQSPEDAC